MRSCTVNLKHWLRLALWFMPAVGFALTYEVHFVGLDDPACMRAIEDASQLVSLQKRPPTSINGLRYRMTSDIPEILRVLHALSYYDASLNTDLEMGEKEPYQVYVFIQSGPQFLLTSYEVYNGDCKHLADIPNCRSFAPETTRPRIRPPRSLGRHRERRAQPARRTSKCGYPLAHIDKRRVEVDLSEKTVQAASCIQEGPLSEIRTVDIFWARRNQTPFHRFEAGLERRGHLQFRYDRKDARAPVEMELFPPFTSRMAMSSMKRESFQ